MKIVIFEDKYYKDLFPLTILRPVYFLLAGTSKLYRKFQKVFKLADLYYYMRESLSEFQGALRPGYIINRMPALAADEPGIIFINGALIPDEKVFQLVNEIPMNHAVKYDDRYAVVKIDKANLEKLSYGNGMFDFNCLTLSESEFSGTILRYFWEFVNLNGKLLQTEINEFSQIKGLNKEISDGVYAEKGVKVAPSAVLDTSNGPIYLAENVKVMANSFIEGPVYIGENSVIKVGAKIYENTSLGRYCKIGGEVENSIILGYSNKQHEGFLGHSYLAKWVNIGAGTDNSDLKNIYSKVRVTLSGESIDTGSQFVGMAVGDHTKFGIGCKINTGSVIGLACNIFLSDYPPKSIDSFSWIGNGIHERFQIDKVLEMADAMQRRRKTMLFDSERTLLTDLYKETE